MDEGPREQASRTAAPAEPVAPKRRIFIRKGFATKRSSRSNERRSSGTDTTEPRQAERSCVDFDDHRFPHVHRAVRFTAHWQFFVAPSGAPGWAHSNRIVRAAAPVAGGFSDHNRGLYRRGVSIQCAVDQKEKHEAEQDPNRPGKHTFQKLEIGGSSFSDSEKDIRQERRKKQEQGRYEQGVLVKQRVAPGDNQNTEESSQIQPSVHLKSVVDLSRRQSWRTPAVGAMLAGKRAITIQAVSH